MKVPTTQDNLWVAAGTFKYIFIYIFIYKNNSRATLSNSSLFFFRLGDGQLDRVKVNNPFNS